MSAWTFRLEMDTIYRGADASNMIEEFQAYGLNKTTMIVVGIFKVLCAIFLLLGLKFKPAKGCITDTAKSVVRLGLV